MDDCTAIDGTNGKTIHADPPIDGFSGVALDKKQVLAWLFGVRREMGAKRAGTPELAYHLQGAQSAVNTLIRSINSGTFDCREDRHIGEKEKN